MYTSAVLSMLRIYSLCVDLVVISVTKGGRQKYFVGYLYTIKFRHNFKILQCYIFIIYIHGAIIYHAYEDDSALNHLLTWYKVISVIVQSKFEV